MSEILQTGLSLSKSAVEADNAKNYSLASTLYEQAILNLKLAIISEKDPSRTALVSQKIEEYTQRNKFIKNLASQQPSTSSTASSSSNNVAASFPSVPPMVSPSISNVTLNSNNSLSSFPSTFPQPPQQQLQQPLQQQQQQFPQPPQQTTSISKLNSLSMPSNDYSSNNKMNRVEAYEIASNFALKGRKEEEVKNYKGATDYYQQACNYFLTAIKSEPDTIMKKSISDEAKIYLDRVETLKPYVQQQLKSSTPPPSSTIQSTPVASVPSTSNSAFSPFPPTPQQPAFPQIPTSNNSQSALNSFPSVSSLNSSSGLNNSQTLQQQQYLMNHRQSNASPTLNLPSTFSGDKCAACGALLSTNSIKALDRYWHAECFSVSIICAGCHKPFSLVNLSLKVKDNRAYHPLCFESTTGLYQEENRTFVGTSKTLFFSIQLQRKFYRAGETIQFGFVIDNATSKKVDKVVAYVSMTETRMEIVGSSYERKARKTIKKLGRCEFFNSNRFPLVKDRFEGDFFFSLPPNLLPSEVAGVDANFVREYQLVVKCVGPPLKIMTVKLRFNLQILEPNKNSPQLN
eukprot:gene7895-9714_t